MILNIKTKFYTIIKDGFYRESGEYFKDASYKDDTYKDAYLKDLPPFPKDVQGHYTKDTASFAKDPATPFLVTDQPEDPCRKIMSSIEQYSPTQTLVE